MGKIENCKIENSKCLAFILGREQKIALAEIEAILRRFSFYPEQGRAGFGFCPDDNYCSRMQAENSSIDSSHSCSNNNSYSILSLQDNIAIIKFDTAFSCQVPANRLMEELGGTVKIFEIIASSTFGDMLGKILVGEMAKNNSSGTLNFAISDYSGLYGFKQLSDMGIQTKIHARKRRPVRFVASRETELSTATSYHKIWNTGGEEFGIFKIAKLSDCYISDGEDGARDQKISNNTTIQQYDSKLLIGRLIATSNPDEWSERDYGKPAGDKYSGMMPPKLARAMVNIALGQAITNNQGTITKQIPNSNSQLEIDNLRDVVVYDPFCGSGNVLMEALLLGCDVIGSDISSKAVQDTKTNLEWLCNLKFKIQNSKFIEKCKSNIDDSIFAADATTYDFAKKLMSKKQSNCVIVTEPFLGKPKKVKGPKSQVEPEISELRDLYLKFFNNLTIQQLNNRIQAICFVFPLIETSDSGMVSLYDECIDDLREMGYNPIRTLKYGRDYQIVKRQIAVFNLQDTRNNNQINTK